MTSNAKFMAAVKDNGAAAVKEPRLCEADMAAIPLITADGTFEQVAPSRLKGNQVDQRTRFCWSFIGESVHTGELLGLVGNTGSSTEPHLHMHIDDQRSFLAGNGVPYEFTQGDECRPVDANVSSPTAISFGPIGAQKPFKNDYPANNALITFR